ncbi:MAG TPA: hypothetical protein VF310_10510, partial [Vicinamibacteria bacterium]
MNALAALTLATLSLPSFPVRQPAPDFTAPGDPFKLVDLRYEMSDTFSTEHAFAARVRVRDFGFVGARFEGEDRALTLQTARFEAAAEGEEGAFTFSGAYRAPRFLVESSARHVTARGQRGWVLRPSLAVRLSREWELLGSVRGDDRPARFLRSASAGFLWQHGTHLEVSGEYAYERVTTQARADNTVDRGTLAAVAQLGTRAELSGGVELEDTDGRFPRRELASDAGLRISLAPRLLLEGAARHRIERGGGSQRSHHYDGALTWFARRFTLPRAGESARQSLALARRATELGRNERVAFDDEERRAQRERLSLARSARDELHEPMLAEYQAQVDERPVPVLGFELVDERDALAGTETRTARVLLGVPWPPAWPWQHREDAVPFLRLDLERERGISGPQYHAIADTLRLTASLNRELDLEVSWTRREPTPLDL